MAEGGLSAYELERKKIMGANALKLQELGIGPTSSLVPAAPATRGGETPADLSHAISLKGAQLAFASRMA